MELRRLGGSALRINTPDALRWTANMMIPEWIDADRVASRPPRIWKANMERGMGHLYIHPRFLIAFPHQTGKLDILRQLSTVFFLFNTSALSEKIWELLWTLEIPRKLPW